MLVLYLLVLGVPLSNYRRMTVDVKFLLAGHPCLFLCRKFRVKGLHSYRVFAAIRGGARNVHPVFSVQHTGNKLTDQKSSGEVSGNEKAYIFLFFAYETSAHIVAGVTKVDIYIVGEKEVTTLGGENMTRAEFENLQKTWTKSDIVINVTEYDYDY